MRTEGWLVSYGLLGLTQNGLVPVLMPLLAADGGGAGLTYAAFSLLGLFAPVLGSWADRFGRHRELLIWGTLGAGVLLLLFDAAAGPLRIVLAAGAGLGVMATTTAGNVLRSRTIRTRSGTRGSPCSSASSAPARWSGCSPRVCWRAATQARDSCPCRRRPLAAGASGLCLRARLPAPHPRPGRRPGR